MTLHTHPTDREIIAALREFLVADVVGSVDEAVSFRGRIAVALLDVLDRQLVLGPETEATTDACLRALGVRDEAELSALIGSGRVEPTDPALLDGLHAMTRDRLRVSNPRYLEPVDDDDPRAGAAAGDVS